MFSYVDFRIPCELQALSYRSLYRNRQRQRLRYPYLVEGVLVELEVDVFEPTTIEVNPSVEPSLPVTGITSTNLGDTPSDSGNPSAPLLFPSFSFLTGRENDYQAVYQQLQQQDPFALPGRASVVPDTSSTNQPVIVDITDSNILDHTPTAPSVLVIDQPTPTNTLTSSVNAPLPVTVVSNAHPVMAHMDVTPRSEEPLPAEKASSVVVSEMPSVPDLIPTPAVVEPVSPVPAATESPSVPSSTPSVPSSTPSVPSSTPSVPSFTPSAPSSTPSVPSSTPTGTQGTTDSPESPPLPTLPPAPRHKPRTAPEDSPQDQDPVAIAEEEDLPSEKPVSSAQRIVVNELTEAVNRMKKSNIVKPSMLIPRESQYQENGEAVKRECLPKEVPDHSDEELPVEVSYAIPCSLCHKKATVRVYPCEDELCARCGSNSRCPVCGAIICSYERL